MRTLLGLTDDENIDTFNAFANRLHPDDLASTLEAINRHLAGLGGYEILEELQKIGVDYAQGYGVAKLLPLPEVLRQEFQPGQLSHS